MNEDEQGLRLCKTQQRCCTCHEEEWRTACYVRLIVWDRILIPSIITSTPFGRNKTSKIAWREGGRSSNWRLFLEPSLSRILSALYRVVAQNRTRSSYRGSLAFYFFFLTTFIFREEGVHGKEQVSGRGTFLEWVEGSRAQPHTGSRTPCVVAERPRVTQVQVLTDTRRVGHRWQ